MRKTSEFTKTTMKIAFAAGIIFWLFRSGRLDLNEIARLLFSPNSTVLVFSFSISIFFAIYRWHIILKSQNIHRPFVETSRLTFIGLFFNLLVPGGVGGDVVKAYYVAHHNPDQKMRSVLTILMDRLLGLFTMLTLALLALALEWSQVKNIKELKILMLFLGFIMLGFCIFWAIIFSKRLSSSEWIIKLIQRFPFSKNLEKIFHSFAEYKALKSVFFRTVSISVLSQICGVFFFVSAGKSLGFDFSLETYFFVVPIGFMTMAIPISPAGIGVGQAAFYYLFNIATGQNTTLGISTITAYQLMTLLCSLIGAYFYVRQKKIEPPPSIE